MKRKLRVAALAVALLSVGLWWAGGAHRGWTQTTVTRWELDAVTGINGPVIERKFVPGVELLAAGVAVALALYGLSFVARKK